MLSQAFRGDIVVKAMEMDAAFFMPKPFNVNSLLDRMRQVARTPIEHIFSCEPALVRNVSDVLREVGVPAHVKGYRYVREAIIIAVQDPGVINAITKELYPEVGRRYRSTASRVERAIRHAIALMWERVDSRTMRRYFGNTITGVIGKPTNSEFIAVVADLVRLMETEIA